MQNRRAFIKTIFVGGSLLSLNAFPFEAFAASDYRITVLHTNDTHSRLEPFPLDDKNYPGQGGIAARASVIEQIRKEEQHVLLLDAGDIFQGTPYFNEYKGEPELKAMSLMGYDCATLGNHDFDLGVDGFLKQMPHAKFPFVVSNYDFRRSGLNNKIKPYIVLKKGAVKIGIFGLGIQLYGLVSKENYNGIWYNDPINTAIDIVSKLKNEEQCDMVICLSHLGFRYFSGKVSDIVLAENTQDIDLIIGGHTHTFLDEPVIKSNRVGKRVIINQMGWGGLRLGRIDFNFSQKKKIKHVRSNTVILSK
ncbi:MAG TPA: metallophosphatase [Edaphocola sp.]|nr:metallophosphatase [Edaphocola sp.]